MTSKILELTEKIYNEGIEKVHKEAEGILSAAKENAKRIEEEAVLKSNKMVSDAKKESETIFEGFQSELQSLADETLAVAKQKIAACIVADYTKQMASDLLSDQNFVKSLLIETVKKWDVKKGSLPDLTVVVSEKQLKEFETLIQSDVSRILQNEPTLQVDPSVKNGFKIVADAEGYQVSFTDDDLTNFLKAFMKPKISAFLFNNSK
jgi:V/A-type H+/Na+-transporting ATPase subunit E